MKRVLLIAWFIAAFAGAPAHATELKPETAAAFDRYVRATEAQMADDIGRDQFLVVDRLPGERRQEAYNRLQEGQIYIQELHSREDDSRIFIPGGLIHHWVGVIFIPHANLAEVVAVLRNYDAHQEIYKPQIRRSRLIERNGDESKVFLQLFNKSLVTVVLNVNFDVRDTQFRTTRRQIATRSTRIAEVSHPGAANEHELPAGNDHGYMWRLNSYWRIEEKDGGTYVQNESVELSRTIPVVFAWLVNPLTKSIPRNVLVHLLIDTRNAVMKPAP